MTHIGTFVTTYHTKNNDSGSHKWLSLMCDQEEGSFKGTIFLLVQISFAISNDFWLYLRWTLYTSFWIFRFTETFLGKIKGRGPCERCRCAIKCFLSGSRYPISIETDMFFLNFFWFLWPLVMKCSKKQRLEKIFISFYQYAIHRYSTKKRKVLLLWQFYDSLNPKISILIITTSQIWYFG